MRTETCQRMHAHGNSISSLTWRKCAVVFAVYEIVVGSLFFFFCWEYFVFLFFLNPNPGMTCTLRTRLTSCKSLVSTFRSTRITVSMYITLVNCWLARGLFCWTRSSGSHFTGTAEPGKRRNNKQWPENELDLKSSFLSVAIFHLTISGYDFGYLLKILTCSPLPAEEGDFFDLLRTYFPCIYDIKYLMKSCKNLKGGLQELANDLQVCSPAINYRTWDACRFLCDSS